VVTSSVYEMNLIIRSMEPYGMPLLTATGPDDAPFTWKFWVLSNRYDLNHNKVTTHLENPEKSGNSKVVREKSETSG